MASKLSIHGRAANRAFYRVEGGVRHEFSAPGGAALISRILAGHGAADPISLGEAFLQEHLELLRLDGAGESPAYAIGRRSGVTPGLSHVDSPPAPLAFIWGSGFEALPGPGLEAALWASNLGLPPKSLLSEISDRAFLMLDADVLRKEGALISRSISWERTATELIWQLKNNPSLSYLLEARHILVTFAEDGAVHLKTDKSGLSAKLVLTHGGGEGSLKAKTKGDFDDAFAVMAAAAALQFSSVLAESEELRALPILKSAEILLRSGYSVERLKNGDFEILEAGEEDEEMAFAIPAASRPGDISSDNWCISNNVGDKRIFDIAYDYVREGPKVIEGLPRLSLGGLTTIDRWEIEAFQNIRNLIIGYVEGRSPRPLSIAVFGSPGSGKSFGVTQIAKNVLPGQVEKLEFNVSQLSGPSDLGAAFQKVRDVRLEGKLPLVFFDEFDSDRDGLPLGWIKSFLMPMQDGIFKDESGEHPLGKCVLVFAGGTAASFEEFASPTQSSDPAAQKAFKNVKGPDFVSRLRGTINVLGPNQKDGGDRNYVLRRALLLRSLCERKLDMGKGGDPVSPNILWAMLLAPRFKHGARSMEAILDMSRIEGNVWEPVSLPFYSQLSLHVDADAFIKLVLREVILNSHVDQLSKAIHQEYLRAARSSGKGGHPAAVEWPELPEDLRRANRAQAEGIGRMLSSIGYAYDAGDTPFPSVEAFDAATTLLLAQSEHLRWMKERLASGWTYGPERDDAKKQTPFLVGWEFLPEVERQKDISAVNNIIPLLKSIGLRIYQII